MGHDPKTDMDAARKAGTMPLEEIRYILYQGKENWERRETIVQILKSDPAFDKSTRDYMTRTEKYERGLRMMHRIFQLERQHNWSKEQYDIAVSLIDDPLPLNLHDMAFQPVFDLQASPSLHAKYYPLISTHQILGCYMQTELGHGTNVQKLETTATFVKETREFEIHSPTMTSRKWWIGSAGKTSTHGVVQARLILPSGEDKGPHLFFVQLRNMHNHKLLPGIQAGDIGPKAMGGYATTDNGYVQFDRVRIPKDHMLSKFANVTEEGEYMKPLHDKLSYGGMVYIRAGMIKVAGTMCAKAATISLRYATVRRQGPGTPEPRIITHSSLHTRLLPILSRAYVFSLLSPRIISSFSAMTAQLEKGDTSLLADVHAKTAGLKVLCTTRAIEDLEVARRSMGGHGFSVHSGLGRMYADYLPSATYEGENYVLDQQVVRAARKRPPPASSSSPPPIDWNDTNYLIWLLEQRGALLVHNAGDDYARISRAVTEGYIASEVRHFVAQYPILKPVFLLYLLSTIQDALLDFYTLGLVDTKGETRVREGLKQVCGELLDEVIRLTDAFGYTDWELDSALGRYDGDVYQALWDKAQQEPLNKLDIRPKFGSPPPMRESAKL